MFGITWDESTPFSSDSSSILRSISEEVLLMSLFCVNISLRRIFNLGQIKRKNVSKAVPLRTFTTDS